MDCAVQFRVSRSPKQYSVKELVEKITMGSGPIEILAHDLYRMGMWAIPRTSDDCRAGKMITGESPRFGSESSQER